ncbi:hypothetical protein ACOSP7_003127 [Xanthoceras sorbifolium]
MSKARKNTFKLFHHCFLVTSFLWKSILWGKELDKGIYWQLFVKDLKTEFGTWNVELIRAMFLPFEADSILRIPTSSWGRVDRILWHYAQDFLISYKELNSIQVFELMAVIWWKRLGRTQDCFTVDSSVCWSRSYLSDFQAAGLSRFSFPTVPSSVPAD